MKIQHLPTATRKTIEVTIEEWGGDIIIRQLSAAEMKELQALAAKGIDVSSKSVKDVSKLDDFKTALIMKAWVGDEGNPVLSTESDREMLNQQPFVVIEKIANAIGVLNGLLSDDDARAKLDAIKKN